MDNVLIESSHSCPHPVHISLQLQCIHLCDDEDWEAELTQMTHIVPLQLSFNGSLLSLYIIPILSVTYLLVSGVVLVGPV